MRYAYFIFDLDDCLIHIPDSVNYFDSILVKTLENLSATIPDRTERNSLWCAGEEYKTILKEWNVSDIDGFWEEFDFTDFNQRKVFIQENKINLYSDVQETLTLLITSKTSPRVALISNTADYVVDYMLKEFKLEGFFQEVFALSSEYTQEYAKPSPLGVQIILENLDYDPKKSRAVLVGDSQADIIAAKKARIEAILIRRNPSKYPEGSKQWQYKPDFVIDTLIEILQ